MSDPGFRFSTLHENVPGHWHREWNLVNGQPRRIGVAIGVSEHLYFGFGNQDGSCESLSIP
ncbi:MAG: hypothetical protein WCA11_12935 [Terracidiphilus sp.]